MYLKTTPPPIPTNLPTDPALVLDLTGVETISAAGIGELVRLRTRLLGSGGRLVLVHVGDVVLRAIEEARLTEMLGVRRSGLVRPEPDEGEAVGNQGAERMCGKA